MGAKRALPNVFQHDNFRRVGDEALTHPQLRPLFGLWLGIDVLTCPPNKIKYRDAYLIVKPVMNQCLHRLELTRRS